MAIPIHDPAAVESFHHLLAAPPAGAACRGMACFANRAEQSQRWAQACTQQPTIYCLGQCHAAPAIAGENIRPSVRLEAPRPVLLENVLAGGAGNLDEYQSRGGGRALQRARAMASDDLIALVANSGLRGRGGAGFSTGDKWAAVRRAEGEPVVVVNADEGDPGAFSDKVLLEEDPYRLIEAIAIAAHAWRAGIVHVPAVRVSGCEPHSQRRFARSEHGELAGRC